MLALLHWGYATVIGLTTIGLFMWLFLATKTDNDG